MSQILEDGHVTKITFSLQPGIKIEIVDLMPFGLEEPGESNEMTNMNAVRYTTFAPKHLITVTPIEGTCNYDPDVYTQIVAMIQVNQQATVIYPDTDRWAIWGYLKSFKPETHKIGEKPTAKFVFVPTNRNNSKVEAGPTKL